MSVTAPPRGDSRPTLRGVLCASCAACFASGLAWVLYARGNHYDFTFDDHLAVRGNADARWGAPWAAALRHDFWGKDLKYGAGCAVVGMCSGGRVWRRVDWCCGFRGG